MNIWQRITKGEVPILATLNKIPGGIMLVPLFLGVLVNTFVPWAIDIGGFTQALWRQGAMPLIAVLLFCSGAQIQFRSAGVALYKGVVLTASKVILGTGAGVLLVMTFGLEITLLGVTPLALVSSLGNNNGGMYTALASKYGTNSDVGGIAILSSTDGPFFEMMLLGAVGAAAIPYQALIAVILPILVGMILGNLDNRMKEFLKPGMAIAILMFAFPLGAALDLRTFVETGAPGILLALIVLIFTGIPCYFIYKLVVPRSKRRSGAPGAAVGTTAGNAIATPAAIAAVDPTFLPFSAAATAQVATAILVTALLCPIMVDFIYKWEERTGRLNLNVPLAGTDDTPAEAEKKG